MIGEKLGKWRQIELLQRHKYTSRHIVETTLYSGDNLMSMLNRHGIVYVKHNTSGQGRGIFKVFRDDNKRICLNGYSIQGNEVSRCVDRLEDFHQLLHPYAKWGRKSATYIIQEAITSNAQNGQPISIRVHIQKLHGKWIISGMNGRVAIDQSKTGIANSHRGAVVYTLTELLEDQLAIKKFERKLVVKKLKKIATRVAKVIEVEAPCREYGIDFGLTEKRKPILFEVNTTPGISSFAKIEDGMMWKRIVEIRKLQREADS